MSGPVRIGEEVRGALEAGRGVVALETLVIGQGLPAPRNLECVDRMEQAIRGAGSIPAWIAVAGGELVAGIGPDMLAQLAEPGTAVKAARKDLPAVAAGGGLGATTVSATIWAAASAGITVGATGGIGGVHPGPDPDVSADLVELARTPGMLVSSGPKSIVDPGRTAERLEELGVALVGYGVDRLPFFLAREAPVELTHRVDDPAAAAALVAAARDLGVHSTVLLCNPIPASAAMDQADAAAVAAEAEGRARVAGVAGAARTPFLLAAMAEISGGRTLEANLALLEDNARVAGEVAAALAERSDVT